MIDVRKLRMLEALARLGTLAAVADELGLTPSGVSMQVSALEKEVGVALTERQGRRVALTPAGSVLAAHGRGVLDRLSLAELELDSLRSGSVGTYTLTAFPSAARTFVADACRRMVEGGSSAIELHLTTLEPEAALEALSRGKADLAVVHAYSNVPREVPRGVVVRTLGTEPVWLATRRPGASAGPSSTRLEDYADLPWIAPTADVTCFEMVERACGVAGFRPRVVAESMDFAVQLELVAAGLGVALVPDLTIDRVPDGVELHRPDTPIERTVLLAHRTSGTSDPGVRRLVEVIVDSASRELRARRPPS